MFQYILKMTDSEIKLTSKEKLSFGHGKNSGNGVSGQGISEIPVRLLNKKSKIVLEYTFWVFH